MENGSYVYNTDFHEGHNDIIVNIIGDGWYNLLCIYDEMELLIENCTQRHIVKSDFIENENKEEADIIEYDMSILFNELHLGALRIKTRLKGFEVSDFEDFAVKAFKIRKQFNDSMLISHGLVLMCNDEYMWKNAIADEIIFRTDLKIDDSIFMNNEQSSCKFDINVNELEINGFELTIIKIPVIIEKELIGSFFIIADNTLNRKNEKELNNKTAVIKEIHHRVKNNLQTIASLLRLQMRRINSKTVEKAFKESINRISSIALIHEELSKGGIEKVNIKSTIASIMEMILTTMIPPGKDVKGQLVGLDVYADANKVSSLALCITELIQNSVEHAFLFRKKGTIGVKIEEADGYIIITVEDDGVGFTRKKSKNSLGLEIIEMITNETLRGTFTIEGHLYGTQSQIKFPIE